LRTPELDKQNAFKAVVPKPVQAITQIKVVIMS